MILGKLLASKIRPAVNYIACSYNQCIYISTDGNSWTQFYPSISVGAIYCAYGEGGTWAIGTDNGLFISTNGYDYSWLYTPLDVVRGITRDNNGTYYIAGSGSTWDICSSGNLAGTYDGEAYPFADGASGIAAAYYPSAVGSGVATQAFKSGGVWYGSSQIFDVAAYSVCWNSTNFAVACGSSSDGVVVAISNSDGNYWTGYSPVYHEVPNAVYAVASNGIYTVIVGEATAAPWINMAGCPDGAIWYNNTFLSGVLTSIFYDGSQWFCGDLAGNIFVSGDITIWTGVASVANAIRNFAKMM